MRYSPRRAALVACIFFLVLSTAAADTVTDLLVPAGWLGWPHATAINNNGWVAGQTVPDAGDSVVLLWIPNGGHSISGTALIVPWQAASSIALDIHDNGDILVEFFGLDITSGDCASASCIPGGLNAVVHAGGGPLLSLTDYFLGEDEWLADLSLWGPVSPRQTNVKGQFIQNLGGAPGTGICSYDYPCSAQLITPGEIPEPSTLLLLATAAGAIALGFRRQRRA